MCPTRYRTRHFFNNSNANEDIATKFEQQYVRCVRNEEECVRFKFRCNILISGKIIKEIPSSVANGTPCISYITLHGSQKLSFFISSKSITLYNVSRPDHEDRFLGALNFI